MRFYDKIILFLIFNIFKKKTNYCYTLHKKKNNLKTKRILQSTPKPKSKQASFNSFNPNTKDSPFITNPPSTNGKQILLQASGPSPVQFDDHMETMLEIGLIYKNFEKRNLTLSNGKTKEINVGVYEFFVRYPNMKLASGKIQLKGETFDDYIASENNKFFLAISLDFMNNKGVFYLKSFDDANNTVNQETLSFNTNGKFFVNRGFQLITGDTGNPEASIHFKNKFGNVIKYHTAKKLTKKSS
jgi:hypothetical protein